MTTYIYDPTIWHYEPKRAKYCYAFWGWCPNCGSYFPYYGATGKHKDNCVMNKITAPHPSDYQNGKKEKQ